MIVRRFIFFFFFFSSQANLSSKWRTHRYAHVQYLYAIYKSHWIDEYFKVTSISYATRSELKKKEIIPTSIVSYVAICSNFSHPRCQNVIRGGPDEFGNKALPFENIIKDTRQETPCILTNGRVCDVFEGFVTGFSRISRAYTTLLRAFSHRQYTP